MVKHVLEKMKEPERIHQEVWLQLGYSGRQAEWRGGAFGRTWKSITSRKKP
jgi:hypothetical protein